MLGAGIGACVGLAFALGLGETLLVAGLAVLGAVLGMVLESGARGGSRSRRRRSGSFGWPDRRERRRPRWDDAEPEAAATSLEDIDPGPYDEEPDRSRRVTPQAD